MLLVLVLVLHEEKLADFVEERERGRKVKSLKLNATNVAARLHGDATVITILSSFVLVVHSFLFFFFSKKIFFLLFLFFFSRDRLDGHRPAQLEHVVSRASFVSIPMAMPKGGGVLRTQQVNCFECSTVVEPRSY